MKTDDKSIARSSRYFSLVRFTVMTSKQFNWATILLLQISFYFLSKEKDNDDISVSMYFSIQKALPATHNEIPMTSRF